MSQLDQETEDKLTVWAVTTPKFNLGTLTAQAQRSRVPTDLSPSVAKSLISKWKRAGKIVFVRGHWKWNVV